MTFDTNSLDLVFLLLVAFRYVVTLVWLSYSSFGAAVAWNNVEDAKEDRANLLKRRPTINGVVLLEANGGVSDQERLLRGTLAAAATGLAATVNLLLFPPLVTAPTQPATPVPIIPSIVALFVGLALCHMVHEMIQLSLSKKRRRRAQLAALELGVSHTQDVAATAAAATVMAEAAAREPS